jgi:hypothetical protein
MIVTVDIRHKYLFSVIGSNIIIILNVLSGRAKFIQLDVFKLGPERSVGAEGSNKGRRKRTLGLQAVGRVGDSREAD